jgi:hypothetical protein
MTVFLPYPTFPSSKHFLELIAAFKFLLRPKSKYLTREKILNVVPRHFEAVFEKFNPYLKSRFVANYIVLDEIISNQIFYVDEAA